MPSSTSSSEAKNHFRLLTVLCLLLALALLTVQRLVRFVGHYHPRQIWVGGPAKHALAQLDKVAQTVEPALRTPNTPTNVIVFGSSRTGRGFDRVAYEAEIQRRCQRDIRAWRFGFGFIGISPLTQRLFARQMAEVLGAWNARWDLAVVELTPFQATFQISEGEYGAGQDEWMAHLSWPGDLLIDLPVAPERSLRLMSYAFFYEGTNPHRLTRYFIERVMGPPPKKPRNPRIRSLFGELQQVEPRWFRIPGWRADVRGAAWAMSASQLSSAGVELLAQIKAELAPQRDDFMQRDRQWRIDCCDAETLQLDPAQLRAFHGVLAQFTRMSARTVVYLPPENRQRLPVRPSGDQRIGTFIRKLPLPVIDLSKDKSFSDVDFYDTTHLDEWGAVKMSTRLAIETARWLCPSTTTTQLALPRARGQPTQD